MLCNKGRTIREVMGGGGGERGIFEPLELLSNSLYEFFVGRSMNNIFLG